MIVISVSQTYWNRGVRNHRKNAKKIWVVYYLDEEDYESDGRFKVRTKRVNFWQAMYYKGQIHKKRRVSCLQCGGEFVGYFKNDKQIFETECPYCDDVDITIVPSNSVSELAEILLAEDD